MAETRDLGERHGTARAEDTRSSIQEAALDLFALQGVEKTSLREIAAQLGVTKAALYYHFTSKDALVVSLTDPFMVDVETLLVEMEARESVPLRELLEAYFDLILKHRKLFQLLLRDASAFAGIGGLLHELVEQMKRVRRLALGPDATAADEIRAVHALGGLQDCAAAFFLLPDDVSADELRRVAVTAAMAALGAGDCKP
jgi:AcrR family transcriptional regulator